MPTDPCSCATYGFHEPALPGEPDPACPVHGAPEPAAHKRDVLAQSVGCCLASTKEDCQRPPCPCNLSAWTDAEKRDLKAKRRKAVGK